MNWVSLSSDADFVEDQVSEQTNFCKFRH